MKTSNKVIFLTSVLISLVCVGWFSRVSFATFVDIRDNQYEMSINKMRDLEILNGVGDNKFNPAGYLTREQFATLIIRVLDLKDNAEANKYKSVFSDVEVGRWSVGYINEAYNNNLITGKTDGLFYPEENITFGQLCTILIKTLGYRDNDVIGIWPNNYVKLSNDLEITNDITISPFDDVRRDQVSYILDKFLDTKIKDKNITIAQAYDIYVEDIVIGNAVTNDTLKYNQIATINNGILDKDGATVSIELGEKYNFVLDNDVIVKAIKSDNRVDKVTVFDYKGGKVTYYEDNEAKSIVLSEKNEYYNNGKRVSFNSLESILKRNTVLIFLYNSTNDIVVEAVTIIDPIHSAPHVVSDNISPKGVIAGFDLNKLPVLKEGKYITKDDIENRDVIYKIDSYFGKNSYYEVISNNVQGELTDILPNKLSPSHIEIDNVSYSLSKYMPMWKLTDATNGYKVSDKVCAILGYDGKVVDLVDKGIKTGKYQKVRVLGNSVSIDTFEKNQVLTDKGIYYVLDDLEELELGAKYEVIIDDDTIVKLGNKEKSQLDVSVRSIEDQKILDNSGKTMLVPNKTTYYYNGNVISYKQLQTILKYNSSIIFVYNENKTGYEYAIVIDPIYSKPEIVLGFNAYQKCQVGDLKFKQDIPVIINGKTTDIYDIDNYTVMYMISDYWANNKYLLVLDTKVVGTIKELIPTRLNVTSIKILTQEEYRTYNFSEYFDVNTLTKGGDLNSYKEGAFVKLYLDKDNKIIYME